jgi:hypothetical protein
MKKEDKSWKAANRNKNLLKNKELKTNHVYNKEQYFIYY